MSSVVEKNDINIEKIFNWGKKFELRNAQDEVEMVVYIRLLGDIDLNKARVYALRKSADLRAKLKIKDSDERVTSMLNPDTMEDERLLYMIVALNMRELTQNVIKSTVIPTVKELKSDSTLEQQEKHQKEIDEFPAKREALIRKNLEKEVSKLEKQLRKLSHDELLKQYEDAMINELCEQKALEAFKDYSAYAGVYRIKEDGTHNDKFFESLDEFLNLPTSIKNQFIAAQQSMELTGEELKKLQPATQ